MDILTDIGSLAQNWTTLGKLGTLIVLVNLVMKLTKMPMVDKYIKPSWRPWMSMGFGVAGGILTSLSSGAPILSAMVTGVMTGLGATGVHEVYASVAPNEKNKRDAAAAVTDALHGPEEQVRAQVAELKSTLDTLAQMSDKKERLAALAALFNKPDPAPAPPPKG